jgi:hypothetical protein
MKNYSTYLAIKEMQIKITLRFHPNLVRKAAIKQIKKMCWGEEEEKGTLIHG